MKQKIMTLLICVVVVAGVVGVFQWKSGSADQDLVSSTENQTLVNEVSQTITAQTSKEQEESQTEPESKTPVSVENGVLILGEPDAPVTISEFSSLSCPHCAMFHTQVLPDLKKDYVDTGKIKFEFNDFPLNRSALDATLLLHCLPAQDRYDFMNLLFEQQESWAFEANHTDKLKQYAALVGMPNDKADACMNDKVAESSILLGMKENSEAKNIRSTPTFIISPGDTVVMGAKPYGSFSTQIEALLNTQQ